MNTDINKLTHEVINCAMEVSNITGTGFTEKVYDRAMQVALGLRGIPFSSQQSFNVYYKDHEVGHFVPDLFVNNRSIVELKAIESSANPHLAQVLNYLKATDLNLGLFLNFGNSKLKIKRVIND
ncbi:GxxExxY protein [Caldithrix abyssi]|nr:GxxExxY protein [Caldithrix abyssi]